MPFVREWIYGDDIIEGEYTYSLKSCLDPVWVETATECPFCKGRLMLCTNAASLGVHRVARILERDGDVSHFAASQFNGSTHVLLQCRPCKMRMTCLMPLPEPPTR